jgi:tetratricopeptide (TPR) repeat protein
MMTNGPAFPGTTGVAGNDPLQRAVFALNNRRPDEAERIANEVLKADPRQARARYILGCAALMQGRAQDAITLLEDAGRGRHDPEIDTQLAIALRLAGRNDDALSRLRRVTKRHPAHAAAFGELGSLLAAMERYDEALDALRRGLEAAPMMAEFSVQLGYVHLARRDSANAKAAFARALEISAGSFEALNGMARAHQEIGENEAAAGYFRRSLQLRPDAAEAWLGLGHSLLELGQRDAGYECFRTAARGDAKRYGRALTSLAAAGSGRFWLKPSAAAQYLLANKA